MVFTFQYIIYDWNSLLADMGGYLGLLLGQSIFGMYHLITSWMNRSKVSQFLKNRNKLTKAANNDANAINPTSEKLPKSVIQMEDIGTKTSPNSQPTW